MSRTELLRELVRVTTQAREPTARQTLVDAGIPLDCGSAWGFDHVEIDVHHYYSAPSGLPAVIVPHFESGELVDLVAVGPRSRSCRTLLGVCTVLGSDSIERAKTHDEYLRLYADPIEWYAAGRVGAVIVDWRIAKYELRGLPGIACDDALTARRIERALRDPVDVPPIYVREACHAA